MQHIADEKVKCGNISDEKVKCDNIADEKVKCGNIGDEKVKCGKIADEKVKCGNIADDRLALMLEKKIIRIHIKISNIFVLINSSSIRIIRIENISAFNLKGSDRPCMVVDLRM